MSDNTIMLPDRDTMLQRLLKVNNDQSMQERFYSILLKQAGHKTKVPEGIVTILALAIYDFVNGMPPVMSPLMYMLVPDFIDALVIDPKMAEETKKFFGEIYPTK